MAEPSLAERARTLLSLETHGVLATLDADHGPYAAPVPFLPDGRANPVMVLPRLDPHVGHAWRHGRGSLSVGGCLTLVGTVVDVPGAHQIDLQPAYVARHPEAVAWVESLEAAWLRIDVTGVRYVDRSGAAHWIEADDLAGAEADPLAPHEPDLLAAIPDDLDDGLVDLAKHLGGARLARSARVLAVDRYGMDLAVDGPAGPGRCRVAFPVRLDDPAAVRTELAAMAAARRDRG